MSERIRTLRQKQAELRARAQRSKESISKISPTTPPRGSAEHEDTASPVTPELSFSTIDRTNNTGANDIRVPSVAASDANDDSFISSLEGEADLTPSRSKSSALKERLRKQEAQLAMLRRRSTLRQSSVEERQDAPPAENIASSPSGASAINDRTKELLAMTAKKKKEVAGRKRQFSTIELQMETMKAIETATARLETLT